MLLVHDRREVADAIADACRQRGGCQCDVVVALNDAKRLLAKHAYDLLVLDLTIPYRGGGQPDYEFAQHLLEDLYRDDEIIPPGDVIAISKDETAIQVVAGNVFASTMAILVEKDGGTWLDDLLNKVEYIKRSAAGRERALSKRYANDLLLICALDSELAPLRRIFEMRRIAEDADAFRFGFTDKSGLVRSGIACAIGKAGPVAAAATTQRLINAYKPRLCLMTGICGGIRKKVDLCDVVAFESVFDWDSGKYKARKRKGALRLSARPEPLSIRGTLIHRVVREMISAGTFERVNAALVAKATKGKIKTFKLRLKPAASGAAVVATVSIAKQISALNEDIAAVDMESYGLYFAARFGGGPKPEVICLKAVSDFCDSRKNDDYQRAAASLSARAAYDVVTKHWDFGIQA